MRILVRTEFGPLPATIREHQEDHSNIYRPMTDEEAIQEAIRDLRMRDSESGEYVLLDVDTGPWTTTDGTVVENPIWTVTPDTPVRILKVFNVRINSKAEVRPVEPEPVPAQKVG